MYDFKRHEIIKAIADDNLVSADTLKKISADIDGDVDEIFLSGVELVSKRTKTYRVE